MGVVNVATDTDELLPRSIDGQLSLSHQVTDAERSQRARYRSSQGSLMKSVAQSTTFSVETPVDGEERFHGAFLWTVASLAALVLWIRPMFTSLWVDEFGTWWVISGTLRDVVARADAVQGQSPVYYVALW